MKKRFLRFTKTEYALGDTVPVSAIYECSECENITAFKKGETFGPCEYCHPGSGQTWYRTNHFIHFVSKNLNTEYEKLETFGIKASDAVAEFAGSWTFIIIFFLFLFVWMYINVVAYHEHWDPYPFILLNLILSTVAAIQAPLILMSQNRQGQKSELRAELDYQTNLSTEKDVAEILTILREIRHEERVIEKETEEVLEEANITFDKKDEPKGKKGAKKTGKKKSEKTREIIKDAGIDIVSNGK